MKSTGIDAAHTPDEGVARDVRVPGQQVIGLLVEYSFYVGGHVAVDDAEAFPSESDDPAPTEASCPEIASRLLQERTRIGVVIAECEPAGEYRTCGDDGRTEQIAAVDQRLDVMQVIRTLAPEFRDTVILREIEGLSYQEIADTLGIPRGTVESRLFRARAEMRKKLTGY